MPLCQAAKGAASFTLTTPTLLTTALTTPTLLTTALHLLLHPHPPCRAHTHPSPDTLLPGPPPRRPSRAPLGCGGAC